MPSWRREGGTLSTARTAVGTRDQALRARARQGIPGGMYCHQSAATLPPEFPQFMERGRGSYLQRPREPRAHAGRRRRALERTDEALAAVRARFGPDA